MNTLRNVDDSSNIFNETESSCSQDRVTNNGSNSDVAKLVPHTILTKGEKYFTAGTLSLVGCSSSITMPIYWVALPEIEHAFNVSEENANLTVTAYLVMQALAPVLFASAGDRYGRRPVIMLGLVGGIATNIGLAFTNTYWLMIFLRILLAASVSPAISISMSAVGDFTTKEDRGGIAGIVNGFTLIGTAMAPFLGSLVNTAWDWKAIFWFSAAFDAFTLILVLLLLPETRRTFVGNLSIRPKNFLHWSPFLLYLGDDRLTHDIDSLESQNKTIFNPLKPFELVLVPEVSMALLPTSILFSTWNMSQATLTTSLSTFYHYSTLDVGLCFFAPGVATVISTLFSGKLLNVIYKKHRERYNKSLAYDPELRKFPPPFNIIKARLGHFFISALLVIIGNLVFGLCIDRHINVAPVLIAIFILSLAVMYPLTGAVTMLIDLYPEKSGSATSLNNFFRCGMSAIFLSCLSRMNNSMTIGGTYSLVSCLCALSSISVYCLILWSNRLLVKRRERRKKRGLPA